MPPRRAVSPQAQALGRRRPRLTSWRRGRRRRLSGTPERAAPRPAGGWSPPTWGRSGRLSAAQKSRPRRVGDHGPKLASLARRPQPGCAAHDSRRRIRGMQRTYPLCFRAPGPWRGRPRADDSARRLAVQGRGTKAKDSANTAVVEKINAKLLEEGRRRTSAASDRFGRGSSPGARREGQAPGQPAHRQ